MTTQQIKVFRSVLNKEDKEYIASQSQKSYRTIEAILNGDRHNKEIESLIINRCQSICLQLIETLKEIKHYVIVPIELETYKTFKTKIGSDDSDIYKMYLDIYLNLSHQTFTLDELWQILVTDYPKIINHSIYCVYLMQKLGGVSDKIVVDFYNKR